MRERFGTIVQEKKKDDIFLMKLEIKYWKPRFSSVPGTRVEGGGMAGGWGGE
jgi:hypothetical protein